MSPTMNNRVVLLLEGADGSTVAVVCNSRDAAEKISAASPREQVGVVQIVSRVDAVVSRA